MKQLLSLAFLAMLGTAPAQEYDVVLLRPTRYLAERPQAGADAHKYLQNARVILDAAGLRHHTLDDDDLGDGIPVSEFLICAYNPNMSAEVAGAIHQFLDAGGHALLCYFGEASLRERLGIGELLYTAGGDEGLFRYLRPTGFAPRGMPGEVRQGSWNAYLLASIEEEKCKPVLEWIAADGETSSGPALVMSEEAAWIGHVMTPGDLLGKARMMLSVIGRWNPAVWERAAEWALRPELGFRYAADIEGLVKLAKGTPMEGEAGRLAAELAEAREDAVGGAAAVFGKALGLRAQAEEIYMAALPSRADRLRGAWVVGVRGVGDWGWEKTARVAAENGLTDLFVRVEWGGRAMYESKVLRMRVEEGDDPLAEGLAACHKHGLRYHAWFINFNWRTPVQEIIDECSSKGLWQIAPDGEERIQEGRDRVYWLNPSEPEVVKLQADMMAEVAADYDVDGVHFDYIRYETYSGSYGERDRLRFEEWAGVGAKEWPADVLRGGKDEPDGPLHERFCEWRCEQVSHVVRAASEAVRAVAPDCQISAAVYPSWPYHRKWVGQDWARWLEEGWIDFVCPMAYGSPAYYDRHVDRTGRAREAAGDKPLIIGLGAWLHPGARTIAEFIVADRELGADGFLLFSYTPTLGEEVLPALRRGVFREE